MGIKRVLLGCLMALSITPLSGAWAKTYDVLELPAVKSELAAKSLIFAVREYHGTYYATGHRGHILFSEDGGDTWNQAEVPVRSTILDIHFPTPELGWAVGHEGVILHSTDAGRSWVKQYDGLRYGAEGLAFYEELAQQNPDNDLYPYLMEEMQFAVDQGADKPLFKVYFHNENYGHALGAYGMILRTEDGGKNWMHVLHSMENDSFYHVFDFAPLPEQGQFFLAGEAGLFMIGDAVAQTGTLVENIPWEGSFFTASAAPDGTIVLGGLRGRMFRTADAGESWLEVEKPPGSSLVDSVLMKDGRMVFAGIAGDIVFSTDNGLTFNYLPVRPQGRIYSIEEGPEGSLFVGGPAGIQKLTLPQ
ncbi:hypothetical protein EY643_08450 [Halioglobus maricola]|uniref:Photosynthesis system II assembly factor Ycf48/Hcf136-like domain-containing protein n=1 Tax=Halioglobus maricola TaxID=2601894 RepID=A0A5P9NIP0_9GAMM|nr:YCF48-related protein [Halioglobus maricola]QFU75681.1 hypothetical protein EY643_08450 [Halioglobus maricola]